MYTIYMTNGGDRDLMFHTKNKIRKRKIIVII